jgi:hypothetical protein
MGRIYPTKVDWWIALMLIVGVVLLVGGAVSLLFGPPAQASYSTAIGVLCLLVAAWTGWIPLSTNYEIGQTELLIRSAGFRQRISLDAIVEVFPTHNPLGSPACSLDRLRVNYRRRNGKSGFALISPREKEEFLRELADAVPGLHLVEDRLVCKGG